MPEKNWFKDGLRFECEGCGNCCKNHSKYEYVWVSEVDIETISTFLSISRDVFISRFCIDVKGYYSILPGDVECPFLENNRCKIYPVRPKQCSTWPFWSENLKKEIWEGPVKDCCPGIGKGDLKSADEILEIAADRDAWYSLN